MDPSAALTVSIVAVVLGGFGLVGGLIGYVQGAAALRRATLARQRAAAAEESALQAKSQADASARAAERALDRLREMGVDPAKLVTGPAPVIQAPSSRVVDPAAQTGPAAVAPAPTTGPTALTPAAAPTTPEPDPRADETVPTALHPATGPTALPPAMDPPPAPTTGPTALPPVTGPTSLQSADRDLRPSPTPAESGPAAPPAEPLPVSQEPEQTPEPAAPNARTAGGQVVAGEQESPPMDWAEALRTGSIPLPALSRGTYAAPARSKKPAPSGPARFELRAVGRQRFEAVNVGGAEAVDAIVEGAGDDSHLVRPLAIGPTTVPAGGTLAFSVLRVDGRSVTALVRWRVDGETASQELPLE